MQPVTVIRELFGMAAALMLLGLMGAEVVQPAQQTPHLIIVSVVLLVVAYWGLK